MTLRAIDGGTNYYAQFTNGQPWDSPNFFPIGVWFESISGGLTDINKDKAIGINVYIGVADPEGASANFDLLRANGMYAFLQANELSRFSNIGSETVGYLVSDEIDMTQGPGSGYTSLQNIINGLPDDGRMLYNNYGKGVMFWETDAQAQQFVNGTSSFGEYNNVVSNDIYWFTDPNVKSFAEGGRFLTGQDVTLTEAQTDLAANYGKVVDEMRRLDAMDGVIQPVWNFIEVGWPFTESAAQGGEAIAPAEIQAAVMHSLIAGARGIIYFNHSFGGPNQTQHALRDPAYAAQRAAVDQIDALIEQLAPVLNSPFDDGYVTTDTSVRVMAKFYEATGDHYVFAGSTQHASSTATFTLAGANPDMDGVALVINEGRSITITDGVWTDFFANGNAWHVYQIDLGAEPPPPPPPDTTPPDAPVIVSFSTDTGTLGDGRTTDTTLALTGTAEANSVVTVFDGATSLGTASANGSGAWTFSTAALSLTLHTFTATAADAAGNVSTASAVLNVTVEAVPPPPPPPTVINGTSSHDTLHGGAGNDTINGFNGQDQIDGAAGNDLIHGGGGKDFIDGGLDVDTLWGDGGADQFFFKAGQSNGDTVADFSGNGSRTGDILMFIGFGDKQDGATFTSIGSNQWQIHSAIDGHNEIITLSNSATVHPNDFLFI